MGGSTMKSRDESNTVDSHRTANDPITDYSNSLPGAFRTICELLRETIFGASECDIQGLAR
jgi:hypothetical protein